MLNKNIPIPNKTDREPANQSFTTLVDPVYHFKSYFDTETGSYLRTNLINSATKQEPFMSSYPQLLDIGIMGHCAHGLDGLCTIKNGYCYQSGGHVHQDNMQFEDYRQIIDESAGKCFQVALGGRGDPDMHEDFEAILKYTRGKGIVPNLTTSGYRLTPEKASLIAEYCGAAAVSWYRSEYTTRAIKTLVNAGVRTNIHFVLTRETRDEAIDLLKNRALPHGINRVIFLLFKPVGEGAGNAVLPIDEKTKALFSLFESAYGIEKIGYDSCTVPGVLQFSPRIDPQGFDACEAGRFSAYITPDLKMVPCSFDQSLNWAVDLKKHSIQNAWESKAFDAFRNHFTESCSGCSKWQDCMGGCPIIPEITLCEAKKIGGVL